MWSLRTASTSDLSIVYDLQNLPYRQQVLDSELPPREQFLLEHVNSMEQGEEHCFLLEEHGDGRGIVTISKTGDFWHATLWGRWLRTLVYAGQVAAFDHLQIQRLVFSVRESNQRMLRICDQYSFKFAGEKSVFVTLPNPPYLGTAKLRYYSVTPEEFHAKAEQMKANSLPLEFRW